jgi:hypothetical protein
MYYLLIVCGAIDGKDRFLKFCKNGNIEFTCNVSEALHFNTLVTDAFYDNITTLLQTGEKVEIIRKRG